MMMYSLATVGFTPLASNRPPLVCRTPTTAVRTHSSQLLLPELPPTLLAASDIDAYASGAEQVRAGLAAGDAIGIFILLSITAFFTIMADDDTISLPEDPLESKPASKDLKTATPGWLTCDMRVPLPEYNDLLKACHLLNTLDGCASAAPARRPCPAMATLPSCAPACVRRERWWLCATPDDFDGCQRSKDFSDYYKHSVYVCQAS